MNVSKMASRRTRLSFKEKSEICELSLQANFDKEKIMDKYGIGKSCLYNTLKQKDSILKMNISKQSGNFKKFSKSKNDDLDTKLVQWVHSKKLINHLSVRVWKSCTVKIVENPSIVEKFQMTEESAIEGFYCTFF